MYNINRLSLSHPKLLYVFKRNDCDKNNKTKFYTGRVRSVDQPFTSFYIPFLIEKVPLTGK